MSIRRLASTALAVASAAGLFLASPTTALAYDFEYDLAKEAGWPSGGSDIYMLDDSGNCRGSFRKDGDLIRVTDYATDGYSCGVQWQTDYGRAGICRNKLGAQTLGDCNKDFKEGHRFTYRVGRCDGDVSNCSVPSGYRDWSGWTGISTG